MQEKTTDYMPRVNTKLVNCNLNFFLRTILSLEKHINIMETIKTYRISNIDVRVEFFLTSEDLKS